MMGSSVEIGYTVASSTCKVLKSALQINNANFERYLTIYKSPCICSFAARCKDAQSRRDRGRSRKALADPITGTCLTISVPGTL